MDGGTRSSRTLKTMGPVGTLRVRRGVVVPLGVCHRIRMFSFLFERGGAIMFYEVRGPTFWDISPRSFLEEDEKG